MNRATAPLGTKQATMIGSAAIPGLKQQRDNPGVDHQRPGKRRSRRPAGRIGSTCRVRQLHRHHVSRSKRLHVAQDSGAVVMPYDWMNTIHGQAGLGDLPHVPIVGYLTRSISALYALLGALLMFLAGDVRRYLPVVRFLAVAGVVFGAMMLAIDCAVGMPLPWTIAEGPYVLAVSAVVLRFSGRRCFPSTTGAA